MHHRYNVRGRYSDELLSWIHASNWQAACAIVKAMRFNLDDVRIVFAEPDAGPLPPSELCRLMRRHRVKIGDLADRLGMSQRRVREIRNGAAVLDVNSARDWMQAVTGTDPGKLQ